MFKVPGFLAVPLVLTRALVGTGTNDPVEKSLPLVAQEKPAIPAAKLAEIDAAVQAAIAPANCPARSSSSCIAATSFSAKPMAPVCNRRRPP